MWLPDFIGIALTLSLIYERNKQYEPILEDVIIDWFYCVSTQARGTPEKVLRIKDLEESGSAKRQLASSDAEMNIEVSSTGSIVK